MSTKSKASLVIDSNWEEVKAEMRRTWRKLSDKDVNGINNYKDLIAKLQDVYEIGEEEVTEKISGFIEKLSLEPNLTRLQEFKEALYDGAANTKEKIESGIKSSVHAIQEKTGDLPADISNYVKENPLKVLGLGVLAAVAIKELVMKKAD